MKTSILFIIIIILASCNNHNSNIDGIWSSNYAILYVSADTIGINSGGRFTFSVSNDSITLKKRINDHTNLRFEELELPAHFGKIKTTPTDTIISSKLFYNNHSVLTFRKLRNKRNVEGLRELHFSITQNGEFNLLFKPTGEIIYQIGKSKYQKGSFNLELKTYSLQLDSNELSKIVNWINVIDFDSVKSDENCGGDLSVYSFSFIYKNDTINSFVCGLPNNHTITPLLYRLSNNSMVRWNDSAGHLIKDNPLFYSKIVECRNDTSKLIQYMRRFDTLNYQFYQFDEVSMKQCITNFYKNSSYTYSYFNMTVNPLGKIIQFEPGYNLIPIDSTSHIKVIEAINSNVKVKPAVFAGRKIQLEDYNSIRLY